MNNHPFHLVEKSPWPLIMSMSMLTFTLGMVSWFLNSNMMLLLVGLISMMLCLTQWFRDMIRESTFQGLHTNMVTKNMKLGMILFIISEIMFFLSFFWCFFHSSLSPSVEIGLTWPPFNIKSFNPMSIPLLNTMILLSSGVSLTWAHGSILMLNYTQALKSIIITILLGFYFTMLQLYEYMMASFCISDSIFGSTFFVSTGFHGVHVLMGTMFIMISMMRLKNLHFSNNHHVGFECSAWYWHFVDVVWLFLYIFIYWWGN
uniref:Cytochrome c oxidase subunit 3 n=1 Tax=Hypsauchenia hardwickii TaxID=2605027 RepID=A0A5B9T574_9HEMI|nr:cytochrome c oxidase subunit III [Hypsauchenia hardwickii]QEG98433.1 cytochrome c oxidase subunit III [Hypsauchenia hardwickii]